MTKIMVVDDSNTVLRAARTALAEEGYEVLTAVDGFSAMALVADHRPDLIFIDIVMPRLDGYQACALIKRNRRYSDIPVVMLSSKDGLFDRARGRIVGAEAHINKPFSKAQLLDMARRYVGSANNGGRDEASDNDSVHPAVDGFEIELADSVQGG